MLKAVKIILILILSLSTLFLSSCSGNPPELDTVKDRLIELIDASAEINDIFFGEGLPVYERDGEFAKETGIYDNVEAALDIYEMVSADCEYLTIDSIKMAAEKVYSRDYLESVYEMAFSGYADTNTGNVTSARYFETGDWLFKNTLFEPFDLLEREYLYDSLEIIKPSSADYINISIDCLVGEETEAITLSFILQDGEWLLDSPTY